METISISLEDLVALVRGETITCGPVRITVVQADLDGLLVALAVNDTMMTLGNEGDGGG